MSSNDYHFITRWRFDATVDEVDAILGDATDLVRWWPAVYLEVEEIEPGGEGGVGKLVGLTTKGWLPYRLCWQFRVVESRSPHGFTLHALGDFVGRGIWTFEQDGSQVDVTYDWQIRAEKPLLRSLTFLLRPIFEANHRWAMAKGEESLRLEIARRRAMDAEARARVPPPPGPSSDMAFSIGAAAVAALAGLAYWAWH